MEEHAQRVTAAATQSADAVTHGGTIEAAYTQDGAIPGGDDSRFTLRGNDHDRCALRSRALLDQHQFASCVVPALLTECNDHLERKEVLTVQVLMQAIEVAGPIAQQDRSWPPLPICMADLQE